MGYYLHGKEIDMTLHLSTVSGKPTCMTYRSNSDSGVQHHLLTESISEVTCVRCKKSHWFKVRSAMTEQEYAEWKKDFSVE
jgi:hypothetical protein